MKRRPTAPKKTPHIAYGRHPVTEVLRAGRRKVNLIRYLRHGSERLDELLALAHKKQIPMKPAERHELSQLTDGANHQGVVAMVEPVPLLDLDSFVLRMKKREKPVAVILDSIVDPQNVGAILRSAETFGAVGVVFGKDRSCDINATVVKSAAGATEYMDFCRVTNIARTVTALRNEGFHVVAADADAKKTVTAFEPTFPLAVILGSEGKGVRPLVRKQCDESIGIPMKGKVASLNVSAAAAIIFHRIAEAR